MVQFYFIRDSSQNSLCSAVACRNLNEKLWNFSKNKWHNHIKINRCSLHLLSCLSYSRSILHIYVTIYCLAYIIVPHYCLYMLKYISCLPYSSSILSIYVTFMSYLPYRLSTPSVTYLSCLLKTLYNACIC